MVFKEAAFSLFCPLLYEYRIICNIRNTFSRYIFSIVSRKIFVALSLLLNFGLFVQFASAETLILIDKIDRKSRPDLAELWQKWQVRIFGEIDVGTLKQLEFKLAEAAPNKKDFSEFAIFLDSPGGNFAESIRLADYVSSNDITTVVDRKAVCLSACAFIFMAGREPQYEGPGGVSRFLHVGGRLGFHAPFLNYQSNVLDTKFDGTHRDVSKAYQTGLEQIGQLLTGYGSTATRWPPSLVGQVLQTPSKKFLYVETVDEAGRWNISLTGFGSRPIEMKSNVAKFRTCLNAFRWTDGEKWVEYSLETVNNEEYSKGWSKQITKLKSEDGIAESYEVPIDNLNALGCKIYRFEHSNQWMVDTQRGGRPVTHLLSSNPEEKLVKLPTN